MGQRNQTFDIMKGITILLVILGHSRAVPFLIKHFIYAFHMPLFFILSGYFFHRPSISKDFKRLIIPYIFAGAIVLFYHIFDVLPHFDIGLLKRDLLKMFWGSGWYHASPIFGDKPYIGSVWFLCALFWCKTIFSFLERKIYDIKTLGLVCVIISIASIIIDRHYIYLPLSFFPGLSALVFFYIGHHAKDIKTIPWWITCICTICYVFIALPYFGRPQICISNCNYDIYPITILGSIGGTLLTYYFSKLLNKNTIIRGVLSWTGRLTLPILCFHYIQSNTGCLKPASPTSRIFLLIMELFFPLICAWICTKFNILGRLFGIRKNSTIIPTKS